MCFRRRKRISLLVPLNGNDPSRRAAWKWLRAYWKSQLPGCEIVIGRDRQSHPRRWSRRAPLPFSKTVAFNNAFRKSHGDVIVLLDADAYLDARIVVHCAERIRAARRAGVRLWFIPYSFLFRLTRAATEALIRTNPRRPDDYPSPPPRIDVESTHGSDHGHKFGAMCQILPREAYLCLRGTDPRFRGWGGEDVAFLMALDTLWGPHVKTPNDILHLWHTKHVPNQSDRPETAEIRTWEGQAAPRANNYLSELYYQARGNPNRMQWLVDSAHYTDRKVA